MGEKLKIEYLNRDKVNSIIYVDGSDVHVENYTDNPLKGIFVGRETEFTYEAFFRFIESRCFPRNCADARYLLKGFDLEEYDPMKIIKITHGVKFKDFN